MSKILIYKEVVPNGEYDIFNPINYKTFSDTVKKEYHSSCPNIGNRAWLQGIIVALNDGENDIEMLKAEMTSDYINNKFDYVVLPMANIFYVGYIEALNNLADVFRNIKIPTYVIACGVQAPSYTQLDNVINAIREPAIKFIRSIYNTGGEFALRGYFTKEFFEKLGFKSAVVTGCPSLYQLGDGLRIVESNVDRIKPVFNGEFQLVEKYLAERADGIYIDQCNYFDLIFAVRDNSVYDSSQKYIKYLVQKYGYNIANMAMDHRILLFTDISLWRKYLILNNYNFSFGSRIHGNIVSILSGIPALIYGCDSRTQEMAEFFSIPMITATNMNKYSLEELYELTDYKKFNCEFKEHYNNFEKFLISHGLVKRIGRYNQFFDQNNDSEYLKYLFGLLEPYKSEFKSMKKRLIFEDYKRKLKNSINTNLKSIYHKAKGNKGV